MVFINDSLFYQGFQGFKALGNSINDFLLSGILRI